MQKKRYFKKKNKKMTLRQRLLIGGFVVGGLCIACSYVLAFLGLDTNSEVTVTVAGSVFAIYGAYVAADTMDHNSINKYGGNKDDV